MNQDENQQVFKKKIPTLFMLLFAVGACLLLTRSVNINEITETVEVAICKESLPTGTVITNEIIVKEVVSRNEVLEGPLPNTMKIIGRVLAVPVVEGQVLTEACFVKEGVGAKIDSQIPHGYRAVTVTVTSKIMPDRALLYPGCVVDVLVCYSLRNRDDGGETVSQTMLVGIHVLAISGDTVVSKTEGDGGAKKRISRATRVTLLVTPKQAQALFLAADNGSLSMTLRNPLKVNNTYQKQKKARWEVETFNGREVQNISFE